MRYTSLGLLLAALASCALWPLCCAAVTGTQVPTARDQEHERADQLRQQVSQRPDDYTLLVELATQLHTLDQRYPDGGRRVPEAEKAYRAAVKSAPSPAAAAAVLSNLGALLLSSGRLQDSLKVIDDCVQLSKQAGYVKTPFYAGSIFNKGKALGMLGNAEEAAATYQLAIEAARGVSAGTFTKAYASLKKFTQEQVADMESALRYLQLIEGAVQQQLPKSKRRRPPDAFLSERWGWLKDIAPEDRSWLHFAMFTAYQLQGNYSKAWQQLQLGNKLQREREGYSGSQDQALLQALKAAFPILPKWRKPAPLHQDPYQALISGQAGHDSEVPIFVIGMPRSGSTLVEQILASHSRVFGAGEDTALAPLIPELLAVLNTQKGLNPAEVAAVGRKYVAQMQGRAAQQTKVALGTEEAPPPFQRIVDKMLRNAWNLGHIGIMLPAAKVLHVVRHPMDVALSCYVQPFEGRGTPWAWDLANIAEQIMLTHDIMDHWEAVLPPGRIMRVPYEALVQAQEATTRRILDFVGLDWEPEVLQFHATARAVQTASLGQVRQQLYTSAVGKWKRYEKQLQLTLVTLQPLVQKYEAELAALQPNPHPADEL